MGISTDQHRAFGSTGLRVPPIMFGTCALGDVRRVIPDQTKIDICSEWFRQIVPPVLVDTALEYGNGAAMGMICRACQRLEIAPEDMVIGQRFGLQAERITAGIVRESWQAGCGLLRAYRPQLVWIAAVDEYISSAESPADRDARYNDIVESLRALAELKAAGEVAGIGLGGRDWRVIQEIISAVDVDWITLAGSFTVMRHPLDVIEFMRSAAERGIAIVHASVFHTGFLAGGSRLDGRLLDPHNPADAALFNWRKMFAALCHGHGIRPLTACVQFCLSAPGSVAVALESSHPDRVAEAVESAVTKVHDGFWLAMKEEGLLAEDYTYLG